MPNQYLTATEFRAKLLSIPNKNYTDETLDDILQVATENVELYTERVFASAYYTETFRGDGSGTFLTYQYPIISIQTITQNTIANPTVSSDYDTDRLILSTDNLAHGRIALDGLDADITTYSALSLYSIAYRAGYLTIPPGVKHATALWAAELLRQNYGLSSQVPELVSMTSEQIVELLNPIRRRRI